MSCKPKNNEDCKCQSAVTNAYRNLLEAGQAPEIALDAAKIVYRHYHPEDMPMVVSQTVEGWVEAGQLH